MKMHDLGETYEPATISPVKKSGKPEPYYPTVNVTGVDALGDHPLGKRIRLTFDASIESHEITKRAGGNKVSTRLKLHAIDVPKRSGAKDKSHLCSKCGTSGAAGYCAECGDKRTPRKKGY